MADEPKTRIVFSGGAEVVVAADVQDVRDKLTSKVKHGEPFTQFKKPGGDSPIHVAIGQIAYVEPGGRKRSGKAMFA